MLEGTWRPPCSDGSGRDRALFQAAIGKLREAGYELRGGRMVRADTGQPLAFEFLTLSREQERIGPFLRGRAEAARRAADGPLRRLEPLLAPAQDLRFRLDHLDYGVSASPGTEQPNRFSSQAADREGSLNYAGVRSPAVDFVLEAMRRAATREDFVAAVRALDRSLLSGFYVCPSISRRSDGWPASPTSAAVHSPLRDQFRILVARMKPVYASAGNHFRPGWPG